MRKLLHFTTILSIFTITACSVNQNKINTTQHNSQVVSNVNIKPYKSQMLQYVNQLRTGGLKCSPPTLPLSWDTRLENAATAHSRDMAINHILSHSGSGTSYDIAKPMPGASSTFVDRISYFGYPSKPYMLIGENITYVPISKTKTTDIMTNFKYAIKTIIHDKTHCEIFMNPRFKYIGMGMYKSNDNKYYFTMDLAEDAK